MSPPKTGWPPGMLQDDCHELSKWLSNRLGARHLVRLQSSEGVGMQVGGKYNWINQPERLVYLGKKGSWHQFALASNPRKVWCEVLEEDLRCLEETKSAEGG